MADEFFLSGLDADQWFGSRFEGFHLFGYIGDREQLDRELHRKSLFRKIVEIAGRRVNIGSILKAVSGFDLIRVDPDKTLAADIIKLVTDQENSRKLNELLQSHYKKAEKDGTYFQGISRRYKQRNLFDADLSRLQGHLITVTGKIVHRSAVAQYSRSLDGTLKASAGEWILCDFPPHALIPDNKHFTGEVILLREDSGFTRTFRDYLPFCLDVCWYPYVRVTGFLDT